MGEWKFDIVSSTNFYIWIHFRGSAVEVFEVKNFNADDKSLIKLQLFKLISLSHYGFCRAIDDWTNKKFFIPDQQVLNNIICVILNKYFKYFLNNNFLQYFF